MNAENVEPNGSIGVIDFRPGSSGPGPDASERMAPEILEADAARAGLELKRRETFLPFQYFLIFGRPAATPPAATSGRADGGVPAPTRRPPRF